MGDIELAGGVLADRNCIFSVMRDIASGRRRTAIGRMRGMSRGKRGGHREKCDDRKSADPSPSELHDEVSSK